MSVLSAKAVSKTHLMLEVVGFSLALWELELKHPLKAHKVTSSHCTE